MTTATKKQVLDFNVIKGQEHAKRGLEVALAGMHSVILVGPPGASKYTLARAAQALDLGYPVVIKENITEYPKGKLVREMSESTIDGVIISTMTPCPCGYFTDAKHECKCTPAQIQKHLENIPRLILDASYIHIEVPRLNYDDMNDKRRGEASATIKARIDQAHNEGRGYPTECDKEASELLKLAILELGISARAYDKILRVAGTIAQLDYKQVIEAHHISEAISYRSLDRNLWG